MATTKIWPVRVNLDSVVDYAKSPNKTENPNYLEDDLQGLYDVMNYATKSSKTEKKYYVSGINCSPDMARQQMIMTKKRYGKEGGIVAFHAYQSFKPGEITPDQAHQLGMQLSHELWGRRFEVIVATHLDKEHIHNHVVINSVSFADGKRYNDCKRTYKLLRDTSDRICKEHGLSVIENPSTTRTPRNIYLAEKAGKPTRYNFMRWDIDEAIRQSTTQKHFFDAMERKGYGLKFNDNCKYWAIKAPGAPHPTRLKTLGDNYTEDAIKDRILARYIRELPPPTPQPTIKHYKFKGNIKTAKRISELQGLYLHYCYLLGIIPKNNPRKPTHPLLKAELLKMDEYAKQTKLLFSHKIETKEQLLDFISRSEQSITILTADRNAIYNKLRRCTNPDKITIYKTDRDIISKRLATLRKDLKSANGVLDRSDEVKNNIQQVRMREIQQRQKSQQMKEHHRLR